jgi:hypothetical protein
MAVPLNREHLSEGLDSASSLDAALLAKFDAGLQCAVDRAREAARASEAATDAGARFGAGLQAALDAAAARPDLTRLCLVEVPGLGGAALERKEAGLQLFVDWLDEQLAAAPGGQRPALVAEMVIGGIYEVLQQRARAGDIDRFPDLAEELCQLWLPVLRHG